MQATQSDNTVEKASNQNKNDFKQTNGFKNPICEQTYRKLPLIYGKRRKLDGSTSSKNKKSKSFVQGKNYFSSPEQNQGKNTSMSKKSQPRPKLSEPKHPTQCTKKNCPCHEEEEALRKMTEKKKRTFSTTMIGRFGFPEVQKFQLQDLESKHKISMQGLTTSSNFKSGLQVIIQEQNQKAINLKKNPHKQVSKKKGTTIANFSGAYQLHKNSLKLSKNSFKYKIKINKAKFDMLQQEQEQDENEPEPQKITKYITRYKTEDAQQSQYAKSVMLKTTTLGHHHSNTKFSQKEKKKIFQKTRSPSQLESGLFKVPEVSEYEDYLRGYISMGEQFDLKALIKSSRFKIQRNQISVYFGELDQQQNRQGYGILVNPKQIFQGEFDNDLKLRGFERNIDGVYVGGYENGQRSGIGAFHWNNGQKFEGLWKNGMKNGQGVWISPKGYKYEGNWLHNRQHGYGVFEHKSSIYKGQFKNFLKDGIGEETFTNGDLYKGQYKEGKPDGKGRYEWKKGGFYDGEFKKGMRQGTGTWIDENNVKYEGSFKADFKHGYGIETFDSGEKYKGQFIQGNRTNGKLFTKNGSAIQIKSK